MQQSMFDQINTIRDQFPALALAHDDGPRHYLDNPAGTQVPVHVLDRMRRALVEHNANMHGHFRTSEVSTATVHEAHVVMADFYNAASEREIVFGPNMTTLTFMMARLLGPRFRRGDEIITTHMEHEGNFSPWRIMAEEHGLVVKLLPFDRDTYEFDLAELDALITDRTRFAALNYASNLLGTINPIAEMTRRLKQVGAIVYVDAVQFAPHGVVDVQALGCDFLVSSAYKWYGPHEGVLWGREDVLAGLPAYRLRTVPDVMPDRFETGSQSFEAQSGVIGAMEYLLWLGETVGAVAEPDASLRPRTRALHAAMRAMVHYEHDLSRRLIDGLSAIDGVVIRGITDPTAIERRVPTVSFTHPDLDPAQVAIELDRRGIYVWNGHSYALPVVEYLGIADRGGVVRIGPTHYNTLDEVDIVVNAVAEIAGHR